MIGQLVENSQAPSFRQDKRQASILDDISIKDQPQAAKKSKLKGFFKRINLELSIILFKLKTAASEVLSSDEIISELFEKNSNKSFDMSMSSTLNNTNDKNMSLIEVMNQTDTFKGKDVDDQIDEEPDEFIPGVLQDIAYENLNVEKLRQELSTPGVPFCEGEKLWNFRRAKWLVPRLRNEQETHRRVAMNSINHISKDYYVTIYENLIDKNKVLKKPINLRDLIKIINIGWISNQRWEKAAQGFG